ncbi:MAG: hypothetical protein OK438_07830 [Thaumarchaeota archaeon]|nr:hypothetical protein [Nitrososphaerota archaeon]
MDPLILLDQAVAQEKVPRAMAKKVRLRMKYVQGAVARVEKASGLRYPPYYIEPTLTLSRSGAEYGETGVHYARVSPMVASSGLVILVQFSAALVAFGSKGTIEAVAAHEFTHYVELVRKLSRTNVMSDESATTLYEASFADSERTVPAKLLFSEKALATLIARKFKPNLSDPSLNKKAGDAWIAKNLPVTWVAPEVKAKIGIEAVASARFDPDVLAKAAEIEKKMKS